MHRCPDTRASLIIRLRDANDADAWSEFVEIYEPLIYQLAVRNGLQHADAAELSQEVLMVVARAAERFDTNPDRGRFRGWLFKITRNLMINYLVSQKNRTSGTGDPDLHQLLNEVPDPNGEETKEFSFQHRRRLFAWAAQRVRREFKEPTWLAFWLTAVESRPVGEVSLRLKMSRGAVYVARSRVMARLRREIERANLEESYTEIE